MIHDSYRTKCGGKLVVPAKTRDHLRAHPEIGVHLEGAATLLTLPIGGAFCAISVDMGRIVGRSGCLATTPITVNDQALFAKRIGRDKASRVSVGVLGPETSFVTILAYAAKEAGTYVLITSFVGPLAEKEPWDPSLVSGSEEAARALDFWCRNALVYDPEVMDQTFEATWAEIIS